MRVLKIHGRRQGVSHEGNLATLLCEIARTEYFLWIET